jgi:hypothetical protein
LKPDANFPRGTSLEILDRPFQAGDVARREQNVDVIRHDDIAVKLVSALLAVVNDLTT